MALTKAQQADVNKLIQAAFDAALVPPGKVVGAVTAGVTKHVTQYHSGSPTHPPAN